MKEMPPTQRTLSGLVMLLFALQSPGCRSETSEQAPVAAPRSTPTPPALAVAPAASPAAPSVAPVVAPIAEPAPPPAPAPTARLDPPPATPITTDPPEPPDPATDPGDPTSLEPLRHLLGDGDPEVVEIVDRRPSGRDELVLYRWYGERAWRARQRRLHRLDAALADLETQIETCEAAAGIASVCLEEAISDKHLMWSAAGTEVFAWEVARVQAGALVVARARLFDVSTPVADLPYKFKVYDVDLDQRSELTVIVPVAVPDHYEGLEEETGEVGFIFEAADLHVQFSATRSHVTRSQDMGGSETSAQTVWLARDLNADRHPDLQVRETILDHDVDDDSDDLPPRADRQQSHKTICLYEPLPDLWRCPEALGQQLLRKPPAPK